MSHRSIHCRRGLSSRADSRFCRRGSVIGLMAVLFPVLAILAAFSINAAQMQLTRTELMVATDAAAKAAGRSFREFQTVDSAKDVAAVTAALNTVQGAPLLLQKADDAGEIEFGKTSQPNGRDGRYLFERVVTDSVAIFEEIANNLPTILTE